MYCFICFLIVLRTRSHAVTLRYPTTQDQTCRMLPQLLSRSTHFCSSVGNPSAKAKRLKRRRDREAPLLICSSQVTRHLILGFICSIFIVTWQQPQTPNTSKGPDVFWIFFNNSQQPYSRVLKLSPSHEMSLWIV